MNENQWITAWHGTNYKYLDSIIKYRLQPPETKLEDGTIAPKTKYIPDEIEIEGIKNWENAIFAMGDIYTAKGYSSGKCVLEVKIKKNSDDNKSYTYYPNIRDFCCTPEYTAEITGIDDYVKYSSFIGNDQYRVESPENIVVNSIIIC